jgi:hypothetical protein
MSCGVQRYVLYLIRNSSGPAADADSHDVAPGLGLPVDEFQRTVLQTWGNVAPGFVLQRVCDTWTGVCRRHVAHATTAARCYLDMVCVETFPST